MIKVYSAEWCQPCKLLKKMLDSNKIQYVIVDIDKAPEDAIAAGVRGVPTTIDSDGNRLIGNVTLTQFKEKFNV